MHIITLLCAGALVAQDPMIWTPNALGLSAAMVQMALFARYGVHTLPAPKAQKAADTEVGVKEARGDEEQRT